jgi:cytochrome c biogenesis protein CcmG/thiol:disulfide interchange protein DsbE
MQRFKNTIPFILLFLLLGLLWHELYSVTPTKPSPSLVGEAIPTFALPELFESKKIVTQKDLMGRVGLLNIWASWCSACQMEHSMLMKIKNMYHIPIYGIVYRDEPAETRQWLEKHGNPYIFVGNDQNGEASVDFGIYGTPETFVISPEGRILYRHIGVINQETWDNTIYPIVKQYDK